MGGNAINKAVRITHDEALKVLDVVYEYILPRFNIEKDSTAIIGSFDKKPIGETYGDLDIVIDKSVLLASNDLNTDEEGLIFINSILEDIGFKSVIYKGMVQVSSGIEVPDSGKIAQVDFMLSPSLEWSKFIYHSPNFRTKESNYKGTYRNLLLAAIVTELDKKVLKYTDDNIIEELEQTSIRLPHGIYRNIRTWKGKKGIIKHSKIIPESYKFITRDPSEVVSMLLGEKYTSKYTTSFESIWNIITSYDYKYKDKLDSIISKFIINIESKKLEVPNEINK